MSRSSRLMSYFGSSTQRSWPRHKPTLNINNVLLLTYELLKFNLYTYHFPHLWLCTSVFASNRVRGISQPACVSLHERISVFVNAPNESSYYCWEPAGRLQWQPVISAPHTLKIPSRWHPFVPLPSSPFSSHQLCSTYSKMSLLLTRQSYVLLLQLNVAVRKISGRQRGVVSCCVVLVILNTVV